MKGSHNFSLLRRFGNMECNRLAKDAHSGTQKWT
jgi:hypothetical protein